MGFDTILLMEFKPNLTLKTGLEGEVYTHLYIMNSYEDVILNRFEF